MMFFNRFTATIAVVTAVFAVGCNSHDTTPYTTEVGHLDGPRTHWHDVPATAQAYEKDFLHRMSDHHASAVAMAQLAERKAVHPELRSMAVQSIKQQQAEISTMRGWLSSWYSRNVDAHVTDDMKPVLSRLAALPPAQFDSVFLEEMIKHHQVGIAMARPMIAQAPHAQVQTLAKTIVNEQSKESEEMTAYLRQWYAGNLTSGI